MMVEGSDEIDSSYIEDVNREKIQTFKSEVSDNRQLLRDNNIEVVNATLNSMKTIVIIFLVALLLVLVVYVYLVSSGSLKPILNNNNFFNQTIRNNITSSNNISFSPVISIVVYTLNNQSSYNVTIYNDTYNNFTYVNNTYLSIENLSNISEVI